LLNAGMKALLLYTATALAKNTAQLHTLFALSNLWMARRALLQSLRA
jgi:IS5 family transposase